MDDGVLVATELMANAAQHTRCRLVRVTISRPGRDLVRIGVVDKSRALPDRRKPDADDVRGRGLALVEAVTCQWGYDRLPWSKRVWGELRCGADHSLGLVPPRLTTSTSMALAVSTAPRVTTHRK